MIGRWLRGVLCAALAASAFPSVAAQADCGAPAAWPLWQDFQARFVQADGRVIDHETATQHSTSEGQSYAMLFALIANDPGAFQQLWQWTENNLLGGDPAARLPAWQWGLRSDGTWGVVDPNAASDADLWLAYALLEAGRAWNKPDYAKQGDALLSRIAAEEVADLPGLGKMLLPGPKGFERPDKVWRLNPSYLPLPVLRRLANHDAAGPWRAIADNTVRLLAATTPRGYAADWVGYQATDGSPPGFTTDPDKGAVGSFDAIRTYLWAGMTPGSDPAAAPLLRALAGMRVALDQLDAPPKYVDVATGTTREQGSAGFSAALLPYLAALQDTRQLEIQRARVGSGLLATAPSQKNGAPPYYDYVLGLFGSGWDEKRYGFLPTGVMTLRWEQACRPAPTR